MSKTNKLSNKRQARESWMWSHDEKGKRQHRHEHSLVTREFNKSSLPSTERSKSWVNSHRSGTR